MTRHVGAGTGLILVLVTAITLTTVLNSEEGRISALQAHERVLEQVAQEKSRLLVDKQEQVQKLNHVVAVQGNTILASRGVGLLDINPGEWRSVTATWYDGQEGINGTGTGITYSGKKVTNKWVVAADTSIYPIGSIIQVEFANGTTQVYQVLDIGGGVKGEHIDIFDPNPADCMAKGKQKVFVRILIKGK